ncbi:MAG: DUF3768 domain-containing protein [Parvibaculum sp.]|uniref:DUF3768 domain-containing protein n=1 Tax=Parvibaculum sp. TaxID=2024848 RepID=UPI00283E8B21|nr:DUF3768 domain-containing protein [Parvibaculum sp.]MDR3500677.1 DUF3768 domain-containing protein [Parvibaculum sp.]
MTSREDIPAIRRLNDELRQHGRGGRMLMTRGIEALGLAALGEILRAVAAFKEFSEDNDPHGEHDFGALRVGDSRIFWKIDYYDKSLEAASPDPTDPDLTVRVMTIMLAEEY